MLNHTAITTWGLARETHAGWHQEGSLRFNVKEDQSGGNESESFEVVNLYQFLHPQDRDERRDKPPWVVDLNSRQRNLGPAV